MAMTKKEKALHDAEITKLKLRLALCWTQAVALDVVPPEGYGSETVLGWLPAYNRVEHACTSAVHHGLGSLQTSSQGSRSLYSSRLLALRALRHEIEVRAANELMRVDEQIEAELQNPTPLPKK